MRSALTVFAAVLALAACSKNDEPKGSAFAPSPVATEPALAAAKPVNPDFDPARNVFFRDCRVSYSVEACSCTVTALKSQVDGETFETLRSMGTLGVISLKGPISEKVRGVLSAAYDACAKKEDELPSAPATPAASPTKG